MFKFIKIYFRKVWKNILLLSIMIITSWVISLIIPFIFGKYIDLLVYNTTILYIKKFIVIYILLSLFNIVISYITNVSVAKIQTKMAFQLNYDTIEHLKKIPLLKINKYNPIYLNQRINTDSNIVISFCLSNYINIFIKLVTMLFSCYMLYLIDFKLTLILLCFIPIYIILYILLKNPLYKLNLKTKNSQNVFSAKLTEQIMNVKSIKIDSSFDLYSSDVIKSFESMFKTIIRYTKISYIFSGLDTVLCSIASSLIFFIGGIKVIKGDITIGQFTMINTYFNMLMSNISYYLGIGKSYQDAKSSYMRIKEILDIQKEKNGTKIINSIEEIRLDNISFCYKDKPVLNNFRFNFKSGNIYCIKGSNGVGKSTLINIIIGILSDFNNGNVYFNEVNINELDMYKIRKMLFSILPQDYKLTEIEMKNIILKIKSKENTFAYEDIGENIGIESLLNTYIKNTEENNEENKFNNFSGGENQKIAIFKAIFKNPKVLILDEPTSALDKEHIKLLKQILSKIKKDKIIILITHNNDILDIADTVINLND